VKGKPCLNSINEALRSETAPRQKPKQGKDYCLCIVPQKKKLPSNTNNFSKGERQKQGGGIKTGQKDHVISGK